MTKLSEQDKQDACDLANAKCGFEYWLAKDVERQSALYALAQLIHDMRVSEEDAAAARHLLAHSSFVEDQPQLASLLRRHVLREPEPVIDPLVGVVWDLPHDQDGAVRIRKHLIAQGFTALTGPDGKIYEFKEGFYDQ